MSRYRLDIEYEGTRYSGWQVQRNARTVQGDIAAAVQRVFDTDKFELQGAGRTDAGVHALQQTAHLDVHSPLAPQVWRLKVNDLLPPDIHIKRVERVATAFHARHDAVSRSYLYQISRRRSAFGKRFVWWIKDPLDISKMRAITPHFVGLHDFRAFADKSQKGDTRVKVDELNIEERGDLIMIRMTASHFLWKMVRQIVGVLAEVGRGKMKVGEIPRLFSARGRAQAALTAPPSGLFLERARYPGEPPCGEIRSLLRVD